MKTEIVELPTVEQYEFLEQILRETAKHVSIGYKGDLSNKKQLLYSGPKTYLKIILNPLFKREHAEMLLGFYTYCKSKEGLKPSDILTTFIHDINGLTNDDSGFLPRSYSYRQFYNAKTFKI